MYVYLFCLLKKGVKQIADMEGVNHSTICYSLRASLKSLKKQTQIKRFRE